MAKQWRIKNWEKHNAWRRAYRQKPEVKAREKAYRQRPDVKVRRKEYFRRDYVRQKKNEHDRKVRRELRFRVLRTLGNKCVRCGEDDWKCLCIDHVNGDGKKDRQINRHQATIPYYLSIIKEVEQGSQRFQILCANCNMRKMYENEEFPNKREF